MLKTTKFWKPTQLRIGFSCSHSTTRQKKSLQTHPSLTACLSSAWEPLPSFSDSPAAQPCLNTALKHTSQNSPHNLLQPDESKTGRVQPSFWESKDFQRSRLSQVSAQLALSISNTPTDPPTLCKILCNYTCNHVWWPKLLYKYLASGTINITRKKKRCSTRPSECSFPWLLLKVEEVAAAISNRTEILRNQWLNLYLEQTS